MFGSLRRRMRRIEDDLVYNYVSVRSYDFREKIAEKQFDMQDDRLKTLSDKAIDAQSAYENHRHCPECGYILNKVGESSSFTGNGIWKRFYGCKYGHTYLDTNKNFVLKKVKGKNDK